MRPPSPFSPTVMDHFLDPRNVGELGAPSGEGWSGSPEAGRYMRLQVRLQAGVIAEVRYQTYGCAPAIAAGSLLTEWAHGRRVEEAQALDRDTLVAMLGGLPKRRLFCADLALDALRAALAQATSPPPAAHELSLSPTPNSQLPTPDLRSEAARC